MRLYQLFFYSIILFFLLNPDDLHSVTSSSSFFNNKVNSSLMLQLCHHDQSLALLQFKNTFSLNKSSSNQCFLYGTDTVTYPKTLSWKENTDCCTWDGVTCDVVTGHVIALHLNCSWLQGTIHSNSSLFRLRHLQQLHLRGNDFCGSPISSQFGGFANLTHLDLSISRFSGLISSEISHLSKLVLLDLSSQYVNRRNTGSLIINNTHSLEKLIQNLTHLENLSLGDVDMSSVEIGSLRNLSSSLTYLRLKCCGMRGIFPDYIFLLPNLQWLSLAGNSDLTVYFPKFNWTSPLWYLSLADTGIFSGEVPNSIANLQSLQYLDLSSINLYGSIPASLGNLTQLYLLKLKSNRFSGMIPSSLSKLQRLKVLDISENRFSGAIHSLICNASHLQILNLSNNRLSGTIPRCVGNVFRNLEVLDLRMNNFRGKIPNTFGRGNALATLNLNHNKLEGPVPQSLLNCTNLEVLDLGNNKMNDTFPYWLDSLPALQVLFLKSNKLHGPIKDSKTKHPFPKLRILVLSDNGFYGDLPTRYIINFIAMMNANEDKLGPQYMLRSNYYVDSIVLTIKGTEIKYERILLTVTTIDLSANKFQGDIPKSIGNLYSLRYLNFSHNNLTGHIPSSLENLKKLEQLDLSSNHLTGQIPGQLTSLTSLAVLNLSENSLEGPIPHGNQFDTFQADSYNGNLELCGPPLSNKCSKQRDAQTLPSEEEVEDDGFEWKFVFMGYGCGMVIGLSLGYLLFSSWTPKWIQGSSKENYKEVS